MPKLTVKAVRERAGRMGFTWAVMIFKMPDSTKFTGVTVVRNGKGYSGSVEQVNAYLDSIEKKEEVDESARTI
jgi:hypothetical protein